MSKKLKLSPWHDGSVKPVHVGIYQTNVEDSISYSFFDGNNWWFSAACIEQVLSPLGGYTGYISTCQDRKWRGVLK